jgi:hypothetical protein
MVCGGQILNIIIKSIIIIKYQIIGALRKISRSINMVHLKLIRTNEEDLRNYSES